MTVEELRKKIFTAKVLLKADEKKLKELEAVDKEKDFKVKVSDIGKLVVFNCPEYGTQLGSLERYYDPYNERKCYKNRIVVRIQDTHNEGKLVDIDMDKDIIQILEL